MAPFVVGVGELRIKEDGPVVVWQGCGGLAQFFLQITPERERRRLLRMQLDIGV